MKSIPEPGKIKVVIVDDDHNSRELLRNYITEYRPDIEVSDLCDSIKSAYSAINTLNPELVFLDVEMPSGSGFDLLRMFDQVNFKVIFVTAYSEYAFDAFRYSAMDFILKPVKLDDLLKSIKKAEEGLRYSLLSNLTDLMEVVSFKNQPARKIVITNSKGFTVLKPEEIIMCKADGYCTSVFFNEKSVIVSSRNLKYYEDLLPTKHFMRVHHSYLINLEHVKEYSCQEEIVLTGSIRCPLSNVHKKEFLDSFKSRPSKKK